MEKFKVLVVDDDPNVCEIIRLYFGQQQYMLLEASSGQAAMTILESESPDMILLDVMMPQMDGYDVCREIRKTSDIPIIMLTARGEEFDRVLGLELGADDYMVKPFSPRELMARIKAISRRLRPHSTPSQDADHASVINRDGITIHIDRREVVVNGDKIALRPKEFDLLVHMAKSPGIVCTREQLLEHVWGYDFLGDVRTVDVHVKKLRQKLHVLQRECIHTVWGVGYKFEVHS